jgi:hypothetical protein
VNGLPLARRSSELGSVAISGTGLFSEPGLMYCATPRDAWPGPAIRSGQKLAHEALSGGRGGMALSDDAGTALTRVTVCLPESARSPGPASRRGENRGYRYCAKAARFPRGDACVARREVEVLKVRGAAAPLATTPTQRATLRDIVRETSDMLAEVGQPISESPSPTPGGTPGSCRLHRHHVHVHDCVEITCAGDCSAIGAPPRPG